MTSTAILTDDTTTIVAEEEHPFRWGVVIAGAFAATATTFFLLTLGAGLGLALVPMPHARTATTFLTMGAIYFLASQAFGFALGGYLVGRLIGPDAENTEEEEFRAGAHGFVMWALAVLAGLLLLAASAGIGAMGTAIAPRADTTSINSSYWVDKMFGPGPNTPQVSADKAEVLRILEIHGPGDVGEEDTAHIARVVAGDDGISPPAAMSRVTDALARRARAADELRHAASITALWTAFALLFGMIVAVASSIAARWQDDKIAFSMKPRR